MVVVVLQRIGKVGSFSLNVNVRCCGVQKCIWWEIRLGIGRSKRYVSGEERSDGVVELTRVERVGGEARSGGSAEAADVHFWGQRQRGGESIQTKARDRQEVEVDAKVFQVR